MVETIRGVPGRTTARAFVTADHYILGTGETVRSIENSGEWIATADPAAVRR